MKYKIIPDDIVKNLIEFLDEIQFEAATNSKPDDLHRINFINYLISELMNGLDGFDTEDEVNNNKDKSSPSDLIDRFDDLEQRPSVTNQFIGVDYTNQITEVNAGGD